MESLSPREFENKSIRDLIIIGIIALMIILTLVIYGFKILLGL